MLMSFLGKHNEPRKPSVKRRQTVSGTPGSSRQESSPRLDPIFNRRVEPDPEEIVLAGSLLAVHDATRSAKSRRGGNQDLFRRLPGPLRDHLDPEFADIFCWHDFKYGGPVKAGNPQGDAADVTLPRPASLLYTWAEQLRRDVLASAVRHRRRGK